MKKALRILFRIFFGLIVLIIILLGTVYLMKDTIIKKTVEHVEEGYQVDIDYESINLNVFRSFPDIGLDIERMKLKHKKDTISMMEMEELNLNIDIMSIFRSEGSMQINGIHLIQPMILYTINTDGTTNFDTFLSSATDTIAADTSTSDLLIHLEEYSMEGGRVFYLDEPGQTKIEIFGLNHSGSGALNNMRYTLQTTTKIDSLTAIVNGTTYAMNYKIFAEGGIDVQSEMSRYTLQDFTLSVNALNSQVDGFVAMKENGIETNLTLKNVESSILPLLTMIPSDFKGDYEDVQASGTLTLNGNIKGTYIYDTDAYPALDLNLSITDGHLQYPGFSEKISNIQFRGNIQKPEGSLSLLEAKINPLQFNVGAHSKASIRTTVTQLMGEPHASGEIQGNLDLNTLSHAYPVPGVINMSGNCTFDIAFDIWTQEINVGAYEKTYLNGSATLKNATIEYAGYPLMKINDITTLLSKEKVALQMIDILIGRSDFKGKATLAQPLNFITTDKPMHITFTGYSKLFDYGDIASEESTSTPPGQGIETDVSGASFLNQLIVDGSMNVGKLLYPPYELNNVQTSIYLKESNLTLKTTKFIYENSVFTIDGQFYGLDDYLYASLPLSGKLNVATASFDVYEYMQSDTEEETSSSNTEVADFSLPEGFNIDINAKIDEVLYDKLVMRNMVADMTLKDNQEFFINRGETNALGGSLSINGLLRAKTGEKPFYDFHYTMKKINIPKTVREVQLVGKLAPILDFMDGLLNTEFQFSGKLEKDLGFDLNSLSLSGVFETMNASINNFAPLNELGSKLNVKELKNIQIENTKNFIEVDKGQVIVKPFHVAFAELNGTLAGSHGLSNNQLNYTLETVIPREWLQKNQLTAKAEQGLAALENRAQSLGLNLGEATQFLVDFAFTGTLTSPKVSMNLKDIGGKSLADAAKDKIKDDVKKIQDSIQKELKSEKERLQKEASARADSIKRALEKEAKKKAQELITGKKSDGSGASKKEIEKVKKDIEEEAEKAKNKLKKWNPFGNK